MWFSSIYDFVEQLKIKYPDLDFCFSEMGLCAPHTYYIKTTMSGEGGWLTFIFDANTWEIREEYTE